MEYYNIRIRPDFKDLFTGTIAVFNNGTISGFATDNNYDNIFFISGNLLNEELKINLTSLEYGHSYSYNLKTTNDRFVKKTIGEAKCFIAYTNDYKMPVYAELVNIEDLKVYLVENNNYKLIKEIK